MQVNRPVLAVIITAAGIGIWVFLQQGSEREIVAGEALAQVLVPELSTVESRGEALFDANCASCHGDNAAGRNGVAPPLVHEIYEPNHHADAAFSLAAQNGVRDHHWGFGNMPPIDGISSKSMSQIVAYVRALQRANGIE